MDSACATKGLIPIYIAPNQVKKFTTTNGNASKLNVAKCVCKKLKLNLVDIYHKKGKKEIADESDALAVALSHDQFIEWQQKKEAKRKEKLKEAKVNRDDNKTFKKVIFDNEQI